MNQDQVKNILLSLEDASLEFTLIFSGKKSNKVNGLYKIEGREIIIHNRNFVHGEDVDNNGLLYTAIHEYAHHLHSCREGGTLPKRAHTSHFWAIFHSLLEIAEKKGVYKNTIRESSALSKLTAEIKEKFLYQNGQLVKDFGSSLIKAMECCKEERIRFEDYIDRILCIPRSAARCAMKMSQYDLNAAVGIDNMRFLSGISNPETRSNAESFLLSGKSPDTVKMQIKPVKQEEPSVMLKKEKLRLERTIESLKERLAEVEKKLNEKI